MFTYKLYSFPVTANDKGKLVSSAVTSFDLDKNVASIAGIALLADLPGMLYTFGTNKLDIGGKEMLPEGFPSSQLMSGITVAPKDKYMWFPEPVAVGSGKLRLDFTDAWQAPAAGQQDIWRPYTVRVLLVQNIIGAPATPTPTR